MAKYTKTVTRESLTHLYRNLSPGDKVYCILRHVSRSGMTRHISLYTIKDGQPIYLTTTAATVLGGTLTKNDYLKVTGCGMDMGWHTVYSLASVLFRQAPIDYGAVESPHMYQHPRDNGYIADNGYLLTCRWL